MTESLDYTTDQDREIEDYVDKNGCSYDYARRRLGLTTLKNMTNAPTLTDVVAGPLSIRGQELADLLYTGRNSDRNKFISQVSLASIHGEISEAEREILYSRRKS